MTGIILINKPKNMTSFGAVARVRRITGEKKAGHTGTLDPMATGVLPVVMGGATRFCELLPVHDKKYRARLKLGVTTDTLDVTGKVLSEREVNVTADEFVKIIHKYLGEIEQVPPMYSALSKDGVRLYELARKGVEVEREKRRVVIHSIELVQGDDLNHEYVIDVSCSAGTYIRTLADDIGRDLGCGGILAELCRTAANGFELSRCFSFEELEVLSAEGRLSEAVIPVDKALTYPKVKVTEAQAVRFSNGGELMISRLKGSLAPGFYSVYSDAERFLGLGEVSENSDSLAVKRVFVDKNRQA